MKSTLVIKFKICGNLRFLSHHETVTMFHRALSRAQVEICYSEGFNPRPRLSLPLPRSVGLQSDDDLLYASVPSSLCLSESDRLKEEILCQLPQDCEICSIEIIKKKISFRGVSAVYVFPLSDMEKNDKVRAAVEDLMRACTSGEGLIVKRQNGMNGPSREKDVGPYIASVECVENSVYVKCNITPMGTIRIDEIMQLLQIDQESLTGPAKRHSVEWTYN